MVTSTAGRENRPVTYNIGYDEAHSRRPPTGRDMGMLSGCALLRSLYPIELRLGGSESGFSIDRQRGMSAVAGTNASMRECPEPGRQQH